MSDEFEFMANSQDPAADFLARESEELGDLGDELGLSQAQTGPLQEEPRSEENGFGFHSHNGAESPVQNVFGFRGEEPESIKKWRVEHEARLQERDEEEAKRKVELRNQAQKELADWYSHYEDQLAKNKAFNREKSQDFVAEVDEIVPGTEWDRVSKLCNFNAKSGSKHNKDVSRLKSIMLQLKQNSAPIKI